MARFRKKPVEIEAWRWLFSPEQEMSPAWMEDALCRWEDEGGAAFWPDGSGNPADGEFAAKPHIAIRTPSGVVRAEPGDYIVRDVKGGLYPCLADIFEATHEPVGEGA